MRFQNLPAFVAAVAATAHLAGCDRVREHYEQLAKGREVSVVIPAGYSVTSGGTKAIISGYDRCPDTTESNCIVVSPKQTQVEVLVDGRLTENWRIVRTDPNSERSRTFVRPNGEQVYHAN